MKSYKSSLSEVHARNRADHARIKDIVKKTSERNDIAFGAPIGMNIDLTDGIITCFRCRLVNGKWIGAEHIYPLYWRLS